jgi:hypothetical protein
MNLHPPPRHTRPGANTPSAAPSSGTTVWPRLAASLTSAWVALGKGLNLVSQTILLALVYFLIVVPTGLIRRLAGVDTLRLRQFKKSRNSVLTTRNHSYTGDDLKNTF